jgi:exodeoxyribonuclease V
LIPEGPGPVQQQRLSMIDLTEEQKRGIQAFAAWYRNGREHGFGERPRFTISGPAGSGKSTLGEYALREAGIDPRSPRVLKMAYTGKAAMVMRQKGLADATTIHSAVYVPVENINETLNALREKLIDLRGEAAREGDAERKVALRADVAKLEREVRAIADSSDDDVSFVINELGPVSEADLVLCDEGSMVGGQIQEDLESFGVPILYLGDNFQLPPIDLRGGSVFFDESGKDNPVDFTLTKIHRQAEGSAIIRHSRDIREGREGQFFTGRERSDDGGVVLRLPMGRIMAEHMARADQVICGRNDTRHVLNAAVREYLGRKTEWPEEGDKLVCLRNSKDLGIINGMMATVVRGYYDFNGKENCLSIDLETEMGARKIDVKALFTYFQYPGDKEALKLVPWWAQKKFAHFDYGYAITAHKCVATDTIVHTSEGILRIGELDNGAGEGEFRPLEGILAHNGSRMERVSDFYRNGEAWVRRITTARGLTLRPTSDHRMLVLGERGILEERFARDLRPGDCLPVPRRTEGFGRDSWIEWAHTPWCTREARSLPERMCPELAEFLGMLVADGSVYASGLRYYNTEGMVTRFRELAKTLFGFDAEVGFRGVLPYHKFEDFAGYVDSHQIGVYVGRFGVTGAAEAYGPIEALRTGVPTAVLRSGKESQRAFLRGWAANGVVGLRDGRFDHVRLMTSHERIFEQIRAMLHNFGVVVTRHVDERGHFRLYIHGEFARNFRDEIGFSAPDKKRDLDLVDDCALHSVGEFPFFTDELKALHGDLTFDRVVDVGEEELAQTVCLRMGETGRFVQGGILAMNSQGSQYYNGIVIEQPLGRGDVMRRRWRYTAVTRFVKNLVIGF